MLFVKTIIIFLAAIAISFLYLVFLARLLVGDWLAVSLVFEAPLVIIAAFMVPMIFITRDKIPLKSGRNGLIYGFFGLLILIFFIMATEKYSLVFPLADKIFYWHLLDPIIFTISASLLLRGVDRSLS